MQSVPHCRLHNARKMSCIQGVYAGRSGNRTDDGGLRANRSSCIDYAQSHLLVTPTRCFPRDAVLLWNSALYGHTNMLAAAFYSLAVVQALLLYGAF